jgi:hypothetical protein
MFLEEYEKLEAELNGFYHKMNNLLKNNVSSLNTKEINSLISKQHYIV